MSRLPVDEIFWRRTTDSELVSFGRNYSALVVAPGTDDPLVLWSEEEGGVEVAQPLITDANGRALGKDGIRPWSDAADYDVIVNGERYPKRSPNSGEAPDLSAYQATEEKGAADGYAGLDGEGKVEAAALPALAISDVSTVASQAAQLALSAEKGDFAVRTDQSKCYIHNGGTAGTMADWTELPVPPDLVLSVAGKTGSVSLGVADVSGAEASANKDTTANLGSSDTKYPTQKAVKSYADGIKNLFPFVNPMDPAYGAKFDGATNDGPALNAALAAVAAAGGGTVACPKGTLLTNETLIIDNSVSLVGAGKEATTIKLGNGKNVPLLKTARYAAGGSTGGAKGFAIRDIGFDGNKANNASLATPTIDLDGLAFSVEHVKVVNGTTVNLRSIAFSREDPGSNMEAKVSDLVLLEAGSTNLEWEGPHDSILRSVIAAKFAAGAGLNIYATGISNWTDCHTYGNTEYGWKIESGLFVNCQAEGTKKGQVQFINDGAKWVGGRVFSAGGEDGKIGFVFGDGEGATANGVQIENVEVANCDNGAFKFLQAAFNSRITGYAWGTEGIGIAGEPADSILWDVQFVGPAYSLASDPYRSYNLDGSTQGLLHTYVDGDSWDRMHLRADGKLSMGGGAVDLDTHLERSAAKTLKVTGKLVVSEKSETIASAATISPADGISLAKITGAVEIKKITATSDGHVLILKFAAGAKLVVGENLKIGATFTATADDAIALVCDGVNWYRIAIGAVN